MNTQPVLNESKVAEEPDIRPTTNREKIHGYAFPKMLLFPPAVGDNMYSHRKNTLRSGNKTRT
jgi:hypothetical protein